jgi:hypothetical protein
VWHIQVVGYFDFSSLLITPVMAAGVTDRVWEIADIVAMLESSELGLER